MPAGRFESNCSMARVVQSVEASPNTSSVDFLEASASPNTSSVDFLEASPIASSVDFLEASPNSGEGVGDGKGVGGEVGNSASEVGSLSLPPLLLNGNCAKINEQCLKNVT